MNKYTVLTRCDCPLNGGPHVLSFEKQKVSTVNHVEKLILRDTVTLIWIIHMYVQISVNLRVDHVNVVVKPRCGPCQALEPELAFYGVIYFVGNLFV
jgi:hypothetical protein